jgi:molybdopterin synthase sulfur carrier subunit
MLVNFFANLRTTIGTKSIQFDLPESSTVHQLLLVIVNDYPAMRKKILNDEDQLLPYVHLFINGKDVQLLPLALQTPLQSQDKIDIFPPVAGG